MKKSTLPYITSMLALVPYSVNGFSSSTNHYSTSATDHFIYDGEGRINFFHGTNFVQKGYPWYPEVLLNEDNIKDMKNWGFNTARLGVENSFYYLIYSYVFLYFNYLILLLLLPCYR